MHSGLLPAPLATLVTNRLRQEIVEGGIEFGQALSEAKIAKRYEVSRTPVREAFARLELEELVRTEPQNGTFVFTMDRPQFAQISEARSILETAALRLSYERNRGALVRQWQALMVEMDASADVHDMKTYSSADGRFHDVLFALSDNPYLEAARRPFSARLAAIRNRMGLSPEHVVKSRSEHRALLNHIENDRLDDALALIQHHIIEKGAEFWAVPEPKPDRRRHILLGIPQD
jgi:DNA-binding GntR family transcriptional regulator